MFTVRIARGEVCGLFISPNQPSVPVRANTVRNSATHAATVPSSSVRGERPSVNGDFIVGVLPSAGRMAPDEACEIIIPTNQPVEYPTAVHKRSSRAGGETPVVETRPVCPKSIPCIPPPPGKKEDTRKAWLKCVMYTTSSVASDSRLDPEQQRSLDPATALDITSSVADLSSSTIVWLLHDTLFVLI